MELYVNTDVGSNPTSHLLANNDVGSDLTSNLLLKNDVGSNLTSHCMPKTGTNITPVSVRSVTGNSAFQCRCNAIRSNSMQFEVILL